MKLKHKPNQKRLLDLACEVKHNLEFRFEAGNWSMNDLQLALDILPMFHTKKMYYPNALNSLYSMVKEAAEPHYKEEGIKEAYDELLDTIIETMKKLGMEIT